MSYCVCDCFLLQLSHRHFFSFFFFNDTATTEIYTLSLHDALPISSGASTRSIGGLPGCTSTSSVEVGDEDRSEEHTSELQSRLHLVCRLLLEKKKKTKETSSISIIESSWN